jgi:CBS domain-containing protein
VLVSQLMMPRPVTVPGDVGLDHALELMDQGDFRHLPVVEAERLVGIVSERDLLQGLGWAPGQSHTPDADMLAPERPHAVSEVMHRAVRTLHPKDDVDTAARLFVGLHIGCLPVVLEDRLEGIITEMDLLSAFVKLCETGVLPEGSDPPVSECMSESVVSVGPHTSLQDAFSVCYARDVRHLPVVEDDRLVGILSDRDLRAAAACGSSEPLRVVDIMSTEVETIRPDQPLSVAARSMLQSKITTLPVMGDDPVLGGDELQGMLSLADILKHCSVELGRS